MPDVSALTAILVIYRGGSKTERKYGTYIEEPMQTCVAHHAKLSTNWKIPNDCPFKTRE